MNQPDMYINSTSGRRSQCYSGSNLDTEVALNRAERTPGEVAVSRRVEGAAAGAITAAASSTSLSTQSCINAVGCKGAKLPAGHRFFPDDEREQWARFIEWAMSRRGQEGWFATLTFKNYKSPIMAERMCNDWLSRLSQALMDTVGGRLKWIRASEWQSRKVIHFHLILLGGELHSLSRKSWEARWSGSGGGFCRIYNAYFKAAPYLAKYLNKSRGGELQWGGAWREGIPSSVGGSRCSSEGVGQQHWPIRAGWPEVNHRHLATGL